MQMKYMYLSILYSYYHWINITDVLRANVIYRWVVKSNYYLYLILYFYF